MVCLFVLLFWPRRKIEFDYNATSENISDVFAVIISQKTKDFGVFAVFLEIMDSFLKMYSYNLVKCVQKLPWKIVTFMFTSINCSWREIQISKHRKGQRKQEFQSIKKLLLTAYSIFVKTQLGNSQFRNDALHRFWNTAMEISTKFIWNKKIFINHHSVENSNAQNNLEMTPFLKHSYGNPQTNSFINNHSVKNSNAQDALHCFETQLWKSQNEIYSTFCGKFKW